MNSLLIVCVILAAIVLMVVLSPFFYGKGGLLQDASASDNIQDLTARQTAILQRWIKDEAAAKNGEVSATEWKQRQRYLTSRYVDVARRVAWLNSNAEAASPDARDVQGGAQ